MNSISERNALDLTTSKSAKRILRSWVPRRVRNWLRSPSASAKWAWDEIKFACGATKLLEVRPGWTVKCHPGAYRCAYVAQDNDAEQVAEFDGFIRGLIPGTTLFDIGAHFGLFSLAATHYGGVGAKVVAVDPSPVAARLLNIQAELNGVSDRLQVIEASVGDRIGRKGMVSIGVQASGYFVAPASGAPTSELTETAAITLDKLAEQVRIVPTHIKIDVEGDEAAVLRGGRQLLSATPAPLLFIELHNEIVNERGDNPAETLALLREHGYETFSVEGLPISNEDMLSRPLIRIVARRPAAESHSEIP